MNNSQESRSDEQRRTLANAQGGVIVCRRQRPAFRLLDQIESSRVLVVARRGRTGEQRRWLAVSIQLDPCHVSTTETSVLKKSEGWSRKRRMALTDVRFRRRDSADPV
ncbi:hypothetical protein GE21DRAFT_1305346 [Neurospora crassa]|nr:hypothetical protein 1A9.70 [imported] - Neurospora crassa [Neurospora crassa]KHE88349.1 hypothetical protein GE21DRAFT_1305346 [Neurospora crassa]